MVTKLEHPYLVEGRLVSFLIFAYGIITLLCVSAETINLADVPCGRKPALFKSGVTHDLIAKRSLRLNSDLEEDLVIPVRVPPLLGNGAQMYILGGSASVRGTHPYMASLKVDNRFMCGATIIAKRHILSAAHCLAWFRNETDADRLKVLIKANDLQTTDVDPIVQELEAEQVIIHPKFANTPRRLDYDIGVIVLKDTIMWDDFVQPICLHDGSYPRKFTRAAVTGWGATRTGGTPSPVMLSTNVPVVPTWVCRFLLLSYLVNDRHVCAGGRPGRDSCQGDSGGPLTLEEADTDVQVGIVSEGFFCGLPLIPAKYTRVSSFVDWISEQVRLTSARDIAKRN